MFTHEIIYYDKNLPIRLMFQRLGEAPKHWHQSMELLLVLSGKLKVTVENDTYTLEEGGIILINPNQIHETYGDNCTVAALQIHFALFQSLNIYERVQFDLNSAKAPHSGRFYEILGQMAHLIKINSRADSDPHTSLLTISCIYTIMYELLTNFKAEQNSISSHSAESLSRLKNITNYIEEHYYENITLKSLAEQQFLSPSYLSHFFEEKMNMNFSSYLTGIRLTHATRELLETDHFIEDIAYNNGFPNSRAFVTAFRRQYNMLPSKYREQQNNTTESDFYENREKHNYLELQKHDFLKILNQYLDKTEQKPAVIPSLPTKNLNFDIALDSSYKKLRHTFKVFTSVGRASDLFNGAVREMLADLQSCIHFQYIKFHGILDDTMMFYREDRDGHPILSYTYIDQAIDFLLSIGLRPLIQFSFMPKQLAKYPDQLLFANPVVISPPKDHDKWCYIIESLTRHFIDRYGLGEVSNWLFTFWNETLSPTPFQISDIELSLELYRLTYNSVKKCSPALRFGNPSLLAETWPYKPFTEFLEFCQNHNCMPDFHILHFYPVATNNFDVLENLHREDFIHLKPGDIILSTDANCMKRFIESYRNEYPNTTAYITEWNSTSSHRDYLNDTCFRAAYICKNVIENYDTMDSFGNWTLTDRIEELPLTDQLFYGGMGLYTINGIKKPAFFAYYFLNKLKDYAVSRQDSCFITTDKQGTFVILLYNYLHYSNFYAQGILFDASSEGRYDVFTENHLKEIRLSLSGFPDGLCDIKETVVNRNYGSCYDEWVRMGSPASMSDEEVYLLKCRSYPMIYHSQQSVTNQTFVYETVLEPHEIRLVEITCKK